MTWWGWIIAGAILLGAELSFVNAQFYLVFIGAAALLVGVLSALGVGIAPWGQWALFGALALLSMVTFRARLYDHFHRRLPDVRSGPAGGLITLASALAPGASCQAEHGGTFWTVRNDSATAIPAGGRARVISVRDLTLLVRPEEHS
jgi:membrane protein implicated in regulation of membrane protease activity